MEVAIEVTLAEAYRSADGAVPSVIFKGCGIGKGWEGPLEFTVRGDGLGLDGLRIGDRYRLVVEPVAEQVVSLRATS